MYDMIILGGGAAGLAAAAYAQSKQRDVLLIAEEVGGKAGTQQQLHRQVGEEELLGAESVQLLAQRVAAHPGAVLRDRVTSVAKVNRIFQVETQHHGRQESQVVLVATGASPLPLDVPGAKQLVNHGIGYSITTHVHLLAGKTAAVIGSTNRALRGVIELANIGAQVYLITPDATGLSTPFAHALRQVPGVTVLERYEVKQIIGTSGVEQIVIAQDGQQSVLQVDAVFADLGLLPNSGIVRRIAQTDPDGFIWVDDQHMTSLAGLFAAGDVTTAFAEQILIAIGDGVRAAVSAYGYVLTHPALVEAEAAD
ncbi:MAG: NAD(P)/FAD-dependent oxidoreductase [Roseiflexaceae bacterium]